MGIKITTVLVLLLAKGFVLAEQPWDVKGDVLDQNWPIVYARTVPRPGLAPRSATNAPPVTDVAVAQSSLQTIFARQESTRGPPPRIGQDPKWTAPSQWGPKGTRPFGQQPPTPTEPQTIPTTTTEAPREPVPFLTTCGRTKYVEDDVSNALIAGCYYAKKGTMVGKSQFPRLFQNTYRFDFGDVRGPYYEFPLIDSAAYVGGDPGPDRVIFTRECYLAGEITQTGATRNGFTECIEEY